MSSKTGLVLQFRKRRKKQWDPKTKRKCPRTSQWTFPAGLKCCAAQIQHIPPNTLSLSNCENSFLVSLRCEETNKLLSFMFKKKKHFLYKMRSSHIYYHCNFSLHNNFTERQPLIQSSRFSFWFFHWFCDWFSCSHSLVSIWLSHRFSYGFSLVLPIVPIHWFSLLVLC